MELPEPAFNIECNDEPTLPVFTADQMRSYAQEAIAQFLESTGQYVTNDASREAALQEAARPTWFGSVINGAQRRTALR